MKNMRFDDDPTDRDKQLVRKHLMHSLKSAMTDELNALKRRKEILEQLIANES